MPSPFVWHELLTSHPDAAQAFYAALFGWEPVDSGFAIGGRRVLGVRKAGIHPHWAPFVRVDDPEGSAAAAVAAGGRVAGRPSLPPGIVLLDPRGVPTVVIAADGADVFAWHVLASTDTGASAAWLAAIAGFSAPPGRGLWHGGEQVGSLVAAAHDRWLVHVLVEDRRQARDHALSLGGTVVQADVDASGHGSFDIVADPQGAAFCIFQAPPPEE
jgi:hypothetical protein